jgi:hypothetical protein
MERAPGSRLRISAGCGHLSSSENDSAFLQNGRLGLTGGVCLRSNFKGVGELGCFETAIDPREAAIVFTRGAKFPRPIRG